MADQLPSDDRHSDDQMANEQLADEQRANEQRDHEEPAANAEHASGQYANTQHANFQHANDQQANEQAAHEPPSSPHDETPPLYRERYEIVRDHDLLLVVKVNWMDSGELVFEFEVSRQVLAGVPYFRRLLTRDFREGEIEVIVLRGDDPKAWKTLLQILHGHLERSSYEIPTDAVWHILLIADKYGISPTSQNARDWFDQWLDTQSREGLFTDQRRILEILLPCHAFDHSLGFSTATMWLAYNSVGHIKEGRPFEGHTHLSLGHGIIRKSHILTLQAPIADCIHLQSKSTQPAAVSRPSSIAVFMMRSTNCLRKSAAH
jgi:hypothetical protein